MIAEYVSAGFRKIHLDCSMSCADDPPVLSDDGGRSAHGGAVRAGGGCLADVRRRAAASTWSARKSRCRAAPRKPCTSSPSRRRRQRAPPSPRMRRRLPRPALGSAWERVIGLVVQPGVEFDHDRVIDYRPDKARALSDCIRQLPHLVFEAHSTDYQTPRLFGRPGARSLRHSQGGTGADLRAARGGLGARSHRAASGAANRTARTCGPLSWAPCGPIRPTGASTTTARASGLELQLEYSLSDRIRYYWPVGSVVAALERLRAAFEDGTAPLALISQYLPGAYDAVRAGEIAARVPDLVVHHVRQVLARYSQACDPKTNPERSAS